MKFSFLHILVLVLGVSVSMVKCDGKGRNKSIIASTLSTAPVGIGVATLLLDSLIPSGNSKESFVSRKSAEDEQTPKPQAIKAMEAIMKEAEAVAVATASPVKKNKPTELDPVKCFPKALCGVSSEVEQLSKRKKNGLITEYLILMKAISRHPDLLEDIIKTKKKKIEEEKIVERQEEDNASGSEEDDEDSPESDESREDEEKAGNDNQDTEVKLVVKNEEIKQKKKAKKNPPKSQKELDQLLIKEKIHMDKLYKETVDKEDHDQFWGSYDGLPPGSFISSPGQKRPQYPGQGFQRPHYRDEYQQQPQMGNGNGPPEGISGKISGFTSYLSNLFGFGESSLTNDPWFPSLARDLKGEVAPGAKVEDTREALETALEVGQGFEKPSQCNEIFNACDYDYSELLLLIDDLRRNVRASLQEKVEKEKEAAAERAKRREGLKTKSEKGNRNKTSTKPKKKPWGKSVISSENDKKKERNRRRKAQKTPSDEYEVIRVTPQPQQPDGPPSFKDSLSLSNFFSWLGFGGGPPPNTQQEQQGYYPNSQQEQQSYNYPNY